MRCERLEALLRQAFLVARDRERRLDLACLLVVAARARPVAPALLRARAACDPRPLPAASPAPRSGPPASPPKTERKTSSNAGTCAGSVTKIARAVQ